MSDLNTGQKMLRLRTEPSRVQALGVVRENRQWCWIMQQGVK